MTPVMMQAVASKQVNYEEAVMSLSPVIYWRLDEQGGVVAKDYSGDLDGTYTNTPTLGVDGLLTHNGGTAITEASASTEHVIKSNEAALNLTGGYTVMCWVDLTDVGARRIAVSKLSATGENGYAIEVNATDGVFRGVMDNTAETRIMAGTTDVSDGNSHFGVYTSDGGAAVIYVDGTSENTDTGHTATSASGNYRVGGFDGGLDFEGTLQEPATFDYALSAGQVAWLFRIGNGQDVSPGDFVSQ